MSDGPDALTAPCPVQLDDKWTMDTGRILLTGTQAIARALLAQKALDGRQGLRTAGYVSGYRGSPLGGVDSVLWSISKRLEAAEVRFQPGVNEELAATAVRGSQQLDAVPDPTHDGVFAAWYGKGPGVDRAGDAIKHGNLAGAHRHGGVVLFYGDDHAGKSSTVAHQSEQAMAAAMVPSLYPANVDEILRYSLLAFALSRFSGSWIGVKCVNEVVEQTASVELDLEAFSPRTPAGAPLPAEGVHCLAGRFDPLREEQVALEYRLPRVQSFVRANGIDSTIFRSLRPRLGLVTAGKSHGDTLSALRLLGLTFERAAALGVSLYKVGCVWPLEPEGLADFAEGHEALLVIEEKKSFIELQAAAVLVNRPDRPRLLGKLDEAGAPLLSAIHPLEPARIALTIVRQLERLGEADPELQAARGRLEQQFAPPPAEGAASPKRAPYFCSGCPHNRSTRVPEGSLSMTGIGCHTMAAFVRPKEALLPTHMGGEGGNWIGLAPYTKTQHIFQNMGDGTYFHSGLLAIRAAVAAGVNITYKILYNDAVAMTGGQPIDGPISVPTIAQQLHHEGVHAIVVVSDNPEAYRDRGELPASTRVAHRDELDVIQRELRDIPGCTAIIYEQTCAAETRRRRKRGLADDPPKRLFISQAVCEGCGDCSAQSTCVSLAPLRTEFGVKRQIDQASCNKDFSCVNGFCPSFITVRGAEPRRPEPPRVDLSVLDRQGAPPIAALGDDGYNVMIAGIGGTGVITVGAILGMAAHIQGLAVSIFDMTGLAQKNGAVYSHLRLATQVSGLSAQRIGMGETDALLAFDLVAAHGDEVTATLAPGRSRILVNSDVTSTVAFQFDRDASIDASAMIQRLGERVGADAVQSVDATTLATALLGDSIATNLFLVGVAVQKGLLPLTVAAVEQAVRLNGAAVDANLLAFRLGRMLVAAPERVVELVPERPLAEPAGLDAIVSSRSAHLQAYQDDTYATRYRAVVERVRAAEQAAAPGSQRLARAVALNYAKLLAYKDEYEVARLLTSRQLRADLERTFAPGGRLSLNLAPPMLSGRRPDGRPKKHEFDARPMWPLLALLARFKGLRATPFDPFGRTAERRMERGLIAEYEEVIERVLTALTPQNHAAAAKLLELADAVRGFGPVKEVAVRAYRLRLTAALSAFECSAPSTDAVESLQREMAG